MKNAFRVILIILMLSLTVFVIASCASADEISISESDKPQVVYILGQNLNLTKGTLVVKNGDSLSEIALNAGGVSVTGYDKNTLGEQTLTVSYGGAETTLKVTVVERVTVKDAVTDYLVGDSFDDSKGRVIITAEDGSSRIIRFASNSVSFSGFTSSKAQNGIKITIKCDLGEEKIEASYNVNVHEIESVEFNEPNVITYDSHYTGEVDVAGGYFLLKGFGGKLSRTVSLTEDMVSGFDVSKVNAENSPYTCKLTVSYDGKSYSYDIKLTYTNVSMFSDNKAKFDSVDWDGENEPVIEKDLGELALKLMKGYMSMSDEEKALIDEQNVFDVARTALVYGFEIWAENVKEFKGVFAIEYGDLVLYLDDYETVEKSLPLFKDKESPIYTLSPLLIDIIELYGDAIVYENETTRIYFDSYPVFDDRTLMVLEDMLKHTLDVYDTLESVPTEWTVADLSSYASAIEAAYAKIASARYVTIFPRIYYHVADWRENGDMFDIIYSYLYQNDMNNEIVTLSRSGLPIAIEELYDYVSGALLAMETIKSESIEALITNKGVDTTELFYNYFIALQHAADIESRSDTMEQYVYLNVPINAILNFSSSESVYFKDMIDYIRTDACGYYDLSSGLLSNIAFEQIMNKYLTIIRNTATINGYESTEDYANEVGSLFNMFVDLSPAEQYSFISTLNSVYALGIPELAFDDASQSRDDVCLFVSIINNFMRSKLSLEHADTYNNLILAIEIYANRFGYPEWEEDFAARIDKVTDALRNISGDDSVNFEIYLRHAYDSYLDIRNKLSVDTELDLGEWADDFDALSSALRDVQTAHYYISERGVYNYNYYFASFETASRISNIILGAATDPAITYAYFNTPLFEAYPADSEEGTDAVYWTFDYAMSVYRNIFIDYLVFFGAESVCIYDSYLKNDMSSFLCEYYYMVSSFVNKDSGATTFDKTKVLSILDKFSKLDSGKKSFFALMEGDESFYYSSLELFLEETYNTDVTAYAVKLFTLEQMLYNYEVSPNEILLQSISATLTQLREMYDSLDPAEDSLSSDFEAFYSYYVEICESLLVSA